MIKHKVYLIIFFLFYISFSIAETTRLLKRDDISKFIKTYPKILILMQEFLSSSSFTSIQYINKSDKVKLKKSMLKLGWNETFYKKAMLIIKIFSALKYAETLSGIKNHASLYNVDLEDLKNSNISPTHKKMIGKTYSSMKSSIKELLENINQDDIDLVYSEMETLNKLFKY